MTGDASRVLKNMKVLYVEDEEIARREMGKLLKRKVGKLYVAEDGKEGLEMYTRYRPDIIIADLVMPVMGGLDMVKEIRKTDHECMIIITTANGEKDSILESVDIGIDKYLIKPFDLDLLNEALFSVATIVSQKKKITVGMTVDEKKGLENLLRKEFAHFMKTETGKGPKEVSAFIQGDHLEIKAFDVLTPMQHALIQDRANTKYVEMQRKLFYSVKQGSLETLLAQILGRNVELKDIHVNVALGSDCLKIAIT